MNRISDRILELAREVQQIPAPTFAEWARGEFVSGLFTREHLKDVSIDDLGNVYACLAGGKDSAVPLVVSAHLDTVFPAGVDLQIKEEPGKIIAPGIGDNSLGVAALMGVVWALREIKFELARDLWLVANVNEEGLGDLRGMRAVVDRFGRDVAGYLVLEGLALGHVYHRGIGVKRYRINASTAGGHSWSDYGQPSAVHELASLVTRITAIRLPREPRTTLNVGTIGGGTGVNVLASESYCELDLRSEDAGILAKIEHQVEMMVQSANRAGVRMTAETIGQRPVGEIDANHPFVQMAVDCTCRIGLDAVLTSGSTDANIPLSLGIPAVVMGITTGGGAHTIQEYINTEPLQRGMDGVVNFAVDVCR